MLEPPEKFWIRGKVLIAGGIAGGLARTLTAPVDRIRLVLQCTSGSKRLSMKQVGSPKANLFSYDFFPFLKVYVCFGEICALDHSREVTSLCLVALVCGRYFQHRQRIGAYITSIDGVVKAIIICAVKLFPLAPSKPQ